LLHYKFTCLDFLPHSHLGTYSSHIRTHGRFYPCLSQSFSWGPALCAKGGDKFSLRNKRWTEDIFLPWSQWFSFKPQFIYIVILLVPSVPLAKETALLCVPELHSEWQWHNLEITTPILIKFVILNLSQQ
jgi:hypothetical protein